MDMNELEIYTLCCVAVALILVAIIYAITIIITGSIKRSESDKYNFTENERVSTQLSTSVCPKCSSKTLKVPGCIYKKEHTCRIVCTSHHYQCFVCGWRSENLTVSPDFK